MNWLLSKQELNEKEKKLEKTIWKREKRECGQWNTAQGETSVLSQQYADRIKIRWDTAQAERSMLSQQDADRIKTRTECIVLAAIIKTQDDCTLLQKYFL